VKNRTRAQKNMERQRQDRVSFSEQYADVLAPNSLVYRMKLLSQLMERRFQQMLEPFQLTPLHWAVLCCLWQSDGMPTVALGRRLGQLRGTLVVVLDAMEKTGYLTRRQDKNDQRISRIFLTKQGRQLMTQLPPMAQELQRQSFHPLSPREIDMLSKQVDILLKENEASGSRQNREPKSDMPLRVLV
jgi:MarR family transcriptional regulator, organic hydroperoxide resistance regulator